MEKSKFNSIILFLMLIELMGIESILRTIDKKYEASNETIQSLEDKNNKIEIEEKNKKE